MNWNIIGNAIIEIIYIYNRHMHFTERPTKITAAITAPLFMTTLFDCSKLTVQFAISSPAKWPTCMQFYHSKAAAHNSDNAAQRCSIDFSENLEYIAQIWKFIF